MKLVYSEVCAQGGRNNNQDYAYCRIQGDKACFIVCDGLGAYYGSDMASKICARAMGDGFIEHGDLSPGSIIALAEDAHNLIIENKGGNTFTNGACTTFAGVFTDNNRTIIAHIGDSRVYRFVAGKIRHCTSDHSLAQLDVENGFISRKDLRYHRDQNKLTRVLGGKKFIPPDIFIIDSPIGAYDSFLLCTDGFWEYVEEEEMENAMASESSSKKLLARLEKLLRSRAPEKSDNYTAVIVRAEREDGK